MNMNSGQMNTHTTHITINVHVCMKVYVIAYSFPHALYITTGLTSLLHWQLQTFTYNWCPMYSITDCNME